jgi:hypothetical protein
MPSEDDSHGPKNKGSQIKYVIYFTLDGTLIKIVKIYYLCVSFVRDGVENRSRRIIR